MKMTEIEMKHVIEKTPKEWENRKPQEWPSIPVGYIEIEDKTFVEYVIYTEYGLCKVMTKDPCKIIANPEFSIEDLPF